jgi:hypothetical protein
MKEKEQLIKEKEKIEQQLAEIEEAEKSNDFKVIKFKDKEFRIYKWEDKKVKDFVYPKGFRMAEFNEFVELYDNKKIVYSGNWEYFWVKHFSKLQQTKKYCLSRLCMSEDDLGSYNDDLESSISRGRVVCVRDLK